MASPSNPELLLKLAREDLASDQLAAAKLKCLQVLATHNHHVGALMVLGQVLHSLGQHDEAVRVFNALTLMEPTVAGHWQNLASALRSTRQHGQALAAFERALQLAPPSAALLYNLGVLQMDRYDFRSAYCALRDAVGLAPADATIRWAFAQCCFDLMHFDEALAALEHWQELHGLTDEITARIACVLVILGVAQQVLPAIERLLANPPRSGRALLILASILERLHRPGEARAMLERFGLSDGDPDNPEPLMLAGILAATAGRHDEAYQHLSLALKKQQELPRRHQVLFPLAKVCDALEHYDEAYSMAAEAHRSQQAFLELAIGRTSPAESRILTQPLNGCDPEDVASWAEAAPALEESPIFIVGFPRSGTTLLEVALDSHPLLRSMDERPFLLKALDEVLALDIRYPADLGRLTANALGRIRARYWSLAREQADLRPGERLVDKCPLNMTLLPLMKRLFPNSQIILTIRHPCDTLLSCFMQDFRAPELALLCGSLTALAKAYSRVFGFWYSQWSLLRPSSVELRYEELTADFPTEVRKLGVFLQLPWDDAMLAPWEHARARGFISTPSYSQVIEPVHNRSVGRWKHYERHFSEALPVLLPWLDRWGFSTA